MPLNLSTILSDSQKAFYQTIFEGIPHIHKLPDDDRDQAMQQFYEAKKPELEKDRSGSAEWINLSAREQDFFKEIIFIKVEIDKIGSMQADQRSELTENLITEKIIPLIHKTFSGLKTVDPSQPQQVISEDDYNALVNKFSSYQHRHDPKFLTLYLQLLIKAYFFDKKIDDKLSLFSGFHQTIEVCAGGMISRLEQYLGNDVIRERIYNAVSAELFAKSQIPLHAEIHTRPFIYKYFFGIGSNDYSAIDVAQHIPFHAREKMCQEALAGDYLDKLLFLDLKNFFRTIFEMEETEFNKLMLNDAGFFNPYLDKNHHTDILSRIGKAIAIAVSSEGEIDDDPAEIIPLTQFSSEIILDSKDRGSTVSVRSFKDRNKAVSKMMHKKELKSPEELAEYYARISIKEARDSIERKHESAKKVVAVKKLTLQAELESLRAELSSKEKDSEEEKALQK